MTPEQLEVCMKVISRITISFGYQEIEDIRQEAFLMCEDIITKWDKIRPLENFLASSLKKRICSLRRDTYFRKGTESGERKRALIDLPQEDEDLLYEIPATEDVFPDDEVEFILDNLPANMRADFFRLANGVSLSPTRKAALFSKVREINGEKSGQTE